MRVYIYIYIIIHICIYDYICRCIYIYIYIHGYIVIVNFGFKGVTLQVYFKGRHVLSEYMNLWSWGLVRQALRLPSPKHLRETIRREFLGRVLTFCSLPGHQNSPKALYSMVFGPKSLNI